MYYEISISSWVKSLGRKSSVFGIEIDIIASIGIEIIPINLNRETTNCEYTSKCPQGNTN